MLPAIAVTTGLAIWLKLLWIYVLGVIPLCWAQYKAVKASKLYLKNMENQATNKFKNDSASKAGTDAQKDARPF